MQKNLILMGLVFTLTITTHLTAQQARQDSTSRKFFVGSTLLLLGNLSTVNNPEYVQIQLGYRISPKNTVSFEFKRSIYSWPLGIPWGPSFDAPGENYPGHARILAPTLAYQHFWWKGAYSAVHALNAFEKYVNEDDVKIGNGYTLYLTYRMGYHITFLKNRFFFEPSIGLTHWPVRTGVPESFKAIERKWPNYFGWEPGLHIGFNF